MGIFVKVLIFKAKYSAMAFKTHSGCQKCSHDPESVAKNVQFLNTVIKIVWCESSRWDISCICKLSIPFTPRFPYISLFMLVRSELLLNLLGRRFAVGQAGRGSSAACHSAPWPSALWFGYFSFVLKSRGLQGIQYWKLELQTCIFTFNFVIRRKSQIKIHSLGYTFPLSPNLSRCVSFFY